MAQQPSGKAPDFDSGIQLFKSTLGCQLVYTTILTCPSSVVSSEGCQAYTTNSARTGVLLSKQYVKNKRIVMQGCNYLWLVKLPFHNKQREKWVVSQAHSRELRQCHNIGMQGKRDPACFGYRTLLRLRVASSRPYAPVVELEYTWDLSPHAARIEGSRPSRRTTCTHSLIGKISDL